MSQREMKMIYDSLLSSGDLTTLFPTLSGEWENDMSEFTVLYRENKRVEEESFLDSGQLFYEDYEEDYE
jgi:hypothetical protein